MMKRVRRGEKQHRGLRLGLPLAVLLAFPVLMGTAFAAPPAEPAESAESAEPAEPEDVVEASSASVSTDSTLSDDAAGDTVSNDPSTPQATPTTEAQPTEEASAPGQSDRAKDDAADPPTNGPSASEGAYTVTPPEVGPPFYTEEDETALRERFELSQESESAPEMGKGKRAFRCFVADPSCGFNVELLATSAYALRFRQGDVSRDEVFRWNSGRAQYDLWINFPLASDVVGKRRYTRLTLGPKAGVALAEEQSVHGNFGVAMRYWLGRGSWAPTIEFSSGISMWLRGTRGNFGVGYQRSPLGLTADVGVGVGGWGAIIVGGQFDTPIARDDLPDQIRLSTAGTFFVGFRGNIAWGVPAVGAVVTQGLTQRNVTAP